ncbi:MAG: glycosyltransferase family 2 protein [Salinivirgaceae bacterium]|nr:glycosyltransferase family 2 protein [Salinivirgaceae bacterium]
MKIALCAIAKYENAYLGEWVRYHIDLGYDHIFLYDDNEPGYPSAKTVLDDKYTDRVTIVNAYGRVSAQTIQHRWYDHCLQNYGRNYDWISFADVDEFITSTDIRRLFASVPGEFDFLVMNLQFFDDNDIVVGDETVPVIERFTRPIFNTKSQFSRICKPSVRCSVLERNLNVRCVSAHNFIYKSNLKWCDVQGREADLIPIHSLVRTEAILADNYIRHYPTKSLSEFCKYKLPRLPICAKKRVFDYYFRYNKPNEEKHAYINDYLKRDLIDI